MTYAEEGNKFIELMAPCDATWVHQFIQTKPAGVQWKYSVSPGVKSLKSLSLFEKF
jgi:hypothetical protein